MNTNYFDEENNEVKPNDAVENAAPTEEDILAKQEKEKATQALKAGYGFLGKWLWYYFILIVPSIIAGIFGAISSVPALVLVGNIISLAVSVATIVILVILGQYDKNYKTAGLLQIPVFVVSLIETIAFGSEVPLWYSGISLVAALVGLYGTYLEFKTHAYVTATVDPMLSANWMKLWKWMMICMIVSICSVFLILIPIIGILIMVAGLIGLVVCSIIKLVYLYRTAKLFQALAF